MDKIVMSVDDVNALLAWRDKNPDLVRKAACPVKSIEISFKHNDLRLVCVRDSEKKFTIRVADGFRKLATLVFDIFGDGMYGRHSGKKCDLKEDEIQSVVTVYMSLMAVMVYGGRREPISPVNAVVVHRRSNRRGGGSGSGVTYILRNSGGRLYVGPSGSHASPSGVFGVRGHWRHYKSGKVVWIAEYKKGTGKKKKSKNYRLGEIENETVV